MAPPRPAGRDNGSILSYFRKNIIPQHGRVDNDTTDDEIVVAPRASSTSNAGSRPQSQASTSGKSSTPPKTKRGRPPKSSSQLRSIPPSSQISNVSTAPRKRGRPRKTESQQQRDAQLRSSSSSSDLSSPQLLTPRESPAARYNINPLDGFANITPTQDSPNRPPSDSPARTRITTVIEIPPSSSHESQSSAMAKSKHAPAPEDHPMGEDDTVSNAPDLSTSSNEKAASSLAPPNASATSTSTLTTVPSSSCLPLSSTSSSRRFTKNGLQGVKDSDDDDSSSADDFPDLSSFVKRKDLSFQPNKRVKLSPEVKPQEKAKPAKTLTKHKPSAVQTASPTRPKYRMSLKDLVAQKEQWDLSRAFVESLENSVAQAERKEEEEEANEAKNDGVIDQSLLADAAGSGSDDQERMVKALKRTEALLDEARYHFFVDNIAKVPSCAPFPADALPDEQWAEMYRDDNSRASACISGLAAEMAARYPLPPLVTTWMMGELCHEPREALCAAYVDIVETALAHEGSVSDTWAVFSSLYRTRSLFTKDPREQENLGLPPGLSHVLQIVPRTALASRKDPSGYTCEAFTDLALMNVDEHILTDTTLKGIVSTSITDMLESLSEETFHEVVSGVVQVLFSPSDVPARVRYRAICSLPGSTKRTIMIRRRLALECFSTATHRKHCDSQDWPASMVEKLDSMPEFQISPTTDYGLLNDLIAVLEIAIDAGWTDHSNLVVDQRPGAWGAAPPRAPMEQHNNQQIDKICQRLEYIASKIQDAGTSHLRRTEVKTSIERLKIRLEYCVRSRPKPKKSVFGRRDDNFIHQRGFKQARFSAAGFVKQETPRTPRTPQKTAGAFPSASTKTTLESLPSSPPLSIRTKMRLAEAAKERFSDSPLSSLTSDDEVT